MDPVLKECNIKICNAECCGPVPIKNVVIRGFKNLINPGAIIKRNGDISLVYHEDTLKCGFLSEECRCKIYENRPDVCRKFGSETDPHPLLKCHFLGQTTKVAQEKLVDGIVGGTL